MRTTHPHAPGREYTPPIQNPIPLIRPIRVIRVPVVPYQTTSMTIAHSLDELLPRVADWRSEGKTIVLTNGVFDLVHYGHVQYLAAARALGDVLIVALNSDDSTRRIKGPLRPLVPEAARAAVIAGLRAVDAVVLFAATTAEQVVAAVQPNVYVKGGDYRLADGPPVPGLKPLPEAEIVRAYGGKVELISYLPGYSTTELINLIRERYAPPGSLGTS